jgi:uncharacterized protein
MALRRFRLIPHDEQFFALLGRSAGNILEGARLLVDLLEHYQDVDRKTRRIRDNETAGIEITHDILRALSRTFVTPIDREDINALAQALEEFRDWIEESARRMRLYKIKRTPKLAQQMGHIILEQAEQVTQAITLLGARKYGDEMDRVTGEIRRLENEADDLLGDAVAGLYDGVNDVPALVAAMRLEGIYELLEETTDKAEQVAAVLQAIAIKQS